jgi:hypothetical protein
MLDIVKLALRYNNSLFDDELLMYIEACKKDLIHCGIDKSKIVDTDQTIQATTIAYCKWMLNYQGRGNDWQKVYVGLKTSLCLDSRY